MAKKFDIQKYKEAMQLIEEPYKKDLYIEVNDALKAVIGLPGFPMGHITQIYGMSDSGKSTLAFHAAVQAQKQGIVVAFIITEGKASLDRAKSMGLDLSAAVILEAEYIEDVFKRINKLMADQGNGTLPVDLLIIVDSIGNTISQDSVTINKDGTREIGGAMMKVSRVIRNEMRATSHMINNTRKVSCPLFAGLIFINHSYKVPPAFPGAPTTTTYYGGDGIYYSSSLVLKTSKGKKIEATVDGKTFKFGLTTKIAVDKNHVSHVSNSGDFIITAHEVIENTKEAINDYKSRHRGNWSGDVTVDSDEE